MDIFLYSEGRNSDPPSTVLVVACIPHTTHQLILDTGLLISNIYTYITFKMVITMSTVLLIGTLTDCV